MERYMNLSGRSAIVKFELGDEWIDVKFDGPEKPYRYSYASAGKHNVDEMKRLAKLGMGLNVYINKHVRKKYERR